MNWFCQTDYDNIYLYVYDSICCKCVASDFNYVICQSVVMWSCNYVWIAHKLTKRVSKNGFKIVLKSTYFLSTNSKSPKLI